jgi:hypothetical protein
MVEQAGKLQSPAPPKYKFSVQAPGLVTESPAVSGNASDRPPHSFFIAMFRYQLSATPGVDWLVFSALFSQRTKYA